MQGAALQLERQLAGEDLPEHHPVAHQTVEGMGKSGRAILLEEQMAEPGKAIKPHTGIAASHRPSPVATANAKKTSTRNEPTK